MCCTSLWLKPLTEPQDAVLSCTTQGYFSGAFEPGKPLNSGCVGLVKASRSERFKEAEVVTGMLPWASHIVLGQKEQVGWAPAN